jgi:formylglycine-generating enzyme required for sulfatase activity
VVWRQFRLHETGVMDNVGGFSEYCDRAGPVGRLVIRSMRCAATILVAAIFTGVAGAACAQTAQPAVGASKINPKDGLTYVWIPPATFRMGCTLESRECLGQELPRHSVTLTKGYWMGQTLVTYAAYKRVIGASGANTGDDQLPIDTVNWDAANTFCTRVGMRLPTEAEFEWAARGGIAADRYGPLDQIAWYRGNSKGRTHAVGQKQPNPYGLYDMLGNVWQWVADWYAPYRQVRPCCDDPAPPVLDPKGPTTGLYHVLRGGSWHDFSADVKMSLRDHPHAPDEESALDYDNYSTGFRCAGD